MPKFPSATALHPKDVAQVLVLDGREAAQTMLDDWAMAQRPRPKVFEVAHIAQVALKFAEGAR